MGILAFIFIGAIVFWIYASNYKEPQYTKPPMADAQVKAEIKNMLKKSFIDSVKTDESIKEVKGTEFEPVVTLSIISNLYKYGMKNFLENRLSMGLTEAEAIYIVKSVTNEVMDIYISNFRTISC